METSITSSKANIDMGYSKTGTVSYKKKPEKGDPGPKGPFVYPAGTYVQGSDTQYTATALTAPLVVYERQMYILNIVGTVGSELNPKEDYAANGNKATWVLMPQYKAAYYEILFTEFAKLGSFIFSGNYMMSQHGVNAQGLSSESYKDFTPDMSAFIPNILIDALTGYCHLGHKNFIVNSDGSGKLCDKFLRWDAQGKLYRRRNIIIEYVTKEEIEANGNVISPSLGTYYVDNNAEWQSTWVLDNPATHLDEELVIHCKFPMSRFAGVYIAAAKKGDFVYYDDTGPVFLKKIFTRASTCEIISNGKEWVLMNTVDGRKIEIAERF